MGVAPVLGQIRDLGVVRFCVRRLRLLRHVNLANVSSGCGEPTVPRVAPLRVRERPSRLPGWVARPPVAGPMSVGCTQGVDGDGVASATSSRPVWRTTRSAGCGWTAPSSEPIASFRHVATDVVAPRVHAGVVHAWPRPYAPTTGCAGSHRLPAVVSDRGGPQSQTATFFPCGGDGTPSSANLRLL